MWIRNKRRKRMRIRKKDREEKEMKEFITNNKAVTLAICGVIIAALALTTVLVAGNAMADNKDYISVETAKTAALSDAGVNKKNVTFTKTKLENEDSVPIYDIEFYTKKAEYDYEIDAVSGLVTSKSTERYTATNKNRIDDDKNNDTGSSAASGNSSSGGSYDSGSSYSGDYIGVSKAKSIALSRAGLSSANWIHAYLDYDDGRAVYELEFVTSNYEYDVEIDARTGSVLDFDKDHRDWDDD